MSARMALVVDDERNVRLTLARALQTTGIDVDTADSGESALVMARLRDYDVVILDLRMPGKDGMEVLRDLRQLRPETKVVVLTAHGSVEAAVEAIKLGAADFVQKPILPQELRAIVARTLQERALEQGAGYDAWVEEASAHLETGDAEAARTIARLALAKHPDRAEALNLLGAVAELSGERRQAAAFYRAALALEPTHGAARHNLQRATSTRPGGELRLAGQRSRRIDA
jgi:DNA-binding NtrC family response regulator